MSKLNELLDERYTIEAMPEADVCVLYNVDNKAEILAIIDEEIKVSNDEDEPTCEDLEENEYWHRLTFESRAW